ncbi:MAG: MlaD family protein [Bacteroidia bacterium]
MINISKEVKIGLIVTGALVAAIWGINYLKGRDLFSVSKEYHVIYPQVNGLAKSNLIKLNGYKVGQVEMISFLPDNSGRILIDFTAGSSIFISEDATAVIASADFLGTKEIQIKLGTSKTPAKNGATLKGDVQLGLTESLGNQVGPVKDKLEVLLQSIDTLTRNLNATFNAQNKKHINESLESLNATLKHFDRISAALDEMSTTNNGEIKTTLDNVNSISKNLKDNNDKIDNIVDNLSAISDSLAAANLKSAIDNLNKNMSEFAIILKKINDGEGSLGALLKDDKLYANLNSSAAHLDSLLIDVKANPKHYVRFSVFGKK